MSIGEEDGGGSNAATLAYKNDPSVENYLALRRANPGVEIEVSVHGGIDALFALEAELKKFGIDAHPLMTGVLDARPDAISELSLILLEKVVRARALDNGGETHLARRGLAMPDSLIDWLTCAMLDSLSWTDNLEIHRDLIVLVRERLGGGRHYQQVVDVHEKRAQASMIGGQLKAQEGEVSIRRVAEIMGVAPSTVLRWFPSDTFQKQVALYSTFFDENGEVRADLQMPKG